KLPMVCGLFTLMITPAGLFAVNEAVFPAPSATIPPCQFEEGGSQSYVAAAGGTQLNVVSADCKPSGIEMASTNPRLDSTSVLLAMRKLMVGSILANKSAVVARYQNLPRQSGTKGRRTDRAWFNEIQDRFPRLAPDGEGVENRVSSPKVKHL